MHPGEAILRALVVHIGCEPLGAFEDVLVQRGFTLHRVELDQGEKLPDWRSFDVLVVMGGPMGATDDDELPWLTEEKRLIGEATREGLPYWGVCLGAQLLAASLGAPVYEAPQPEIGVMPVELTTAARSDPVFGTLPKEILTFQWHADTFDLPEGATLLARSPGCPHQAFRWGRYAYGLQFHQEVSAEMAEDWGRVPTYRASLESATGADSLPRLVEGIGRHQEGLNRMARAMFGRWLELTSALSDP